MHKVEAGGYTAWLVLCYHLLEAMDNRNLMWMKSFYNFCSVIYVDGHKQWLLFLFQKVFYQILAKELYLETRSQKV